MRSWGSNGRFFRCRGSWGESAAWAADWIIWVQPGDPVALPGEIAPALVDGLGSQRLQVFPSAPAALVAFLEREAYAMDD